MSVTFADVDAAVGRVRGRIVRTPLLESAALNARVGGRVLVKPECLQLPGAFKVRGALNRILCLGAKEQAAGVVAFSSGNFGRGLAAASQQSKVPCTIVMPADAPEKKKAGARRYGATVVESPIEPGVNREVTAARVAEEISAKDGATLLHPFEDHDVIAGQGTCGVEICEDLAAAQIRADTVIIPAGGGGLSAGCNTAFKHLLPSVHSYLVEPAHYDDHARSLASGARVSVSNNAPFTICDALQAAAPGRNTLPINQSFVKGGLAVSDAEVKEAMAAAKATLGLELEPSGACALAAVLFGKVPVQGRTTVVVASGGNPDALPDRSKVTQHGPLRHPGAAPKL
eukprot:TRINITY_DN25279_c0_g1_i1.p1 TRINITY_DN25279_c0_g1~~TRINITY_DN25279_c0_g1_i1.p1  ORF type:complete len:343 (+),score=125.41 TRINITY_DN25279_c0_g1_i1:70-1098(+)